MARRIPSDGDLIFDVEPGDESTEAFRSLRFGDAYQGTDTGDIVFRAGRQERARIKADGTGTGLLGSALPAIRAADYGASPSASAATNKTAIDTAMAEAAALGGGAVVLPAAMSGTPLLTNGGHDVPAGVEVWGQGDTATVVMNRGASYTFRLSNQTLGQQSPALRRMTIVGSDSGTHAAVAGGIGVQVSNGIRAVLEDVWIGGFTGAGSIGLQFLNRNSTANLCEHTEGRNVAVINCTTLIQFLSQAGAGESFGYTHLRNLYLQVYASQTAIDVGGVGPVTANLYNSRIEGSLHYTGNGGVGISVSAHGAVFQGAWFSLAGEVLSGTGLTRISVTSGGTFYADGKFFVANGQPTDNFTSGSFDFVEQPYSEAELPSTSRSIASATAITVPPGSTFFTVAGTTNISQILGGWSGRIVSLKFAGVLTVSDGVNNLQLAGNFVTAVGSQLTLVYENGTWYEIARSNN